MHEEPFTQALLDMALLKAGGRTITELRLEVGRFSAIVPAAVEVFFRLLSEGTPAQGAALVFETIPVELTCTACGKTGRLDIPPTMPVRPALALALGRGCACGRGRLKISGGLGFDLLGLTVDDGPPGS
jgi:Zn finger protein HypA/HybF involved in hydrogenase expression